MSKISKTFFGNKEYRIDPKGRVPLSADYYSKLDLNEENSSIIVVCSPFEEKRYLEVFSEEQWAREMKRIRRMEEGKVKTHLMNNYISKAESIQIDGQSRIRLPKYMIDYAGIDKDVVFVGVIKNLRIWAKEKLEIERSCIHVSQEDIEAEMNKVMRLMPDDEEDE